jgi:ribonuclease BN (tRNA processing enzyme)
MKVLAALAVVAVVAAFGYLQGYVDRDAGREMRLATRALACGTGMPNQRPAQKATCWLVELGNGDKFLFDIGTGSSDNLSALLIPYEFLNKVFISHLHADHFGDLDALYVGGLISGRVGSLHVWGPSGSRPELGTAAAVEGLKKMLAWDIEGRKGRLPSSGQVLEVHEFDYMGDNERSQVRVQRRHLPEPVVRGVRAGRGCRRPRMLHRDPGSRGQDELPRFSGAGGGHTDSHTAPCIREGHELGGAAASRRVPFLQ